MGLLNSKTRKRIRIYFHFVKHISGINDLMRQILIAFEYQFQKGSD